MTYVKPHLHTRTLTREQVLGRYKGLCALSAFYIATLKTTALLLSMPAMQKPCKERFTLLGIQQECTAELLKVRGDFDVLKRETPLTLLRLLGAEFGAIADKYFGAEPSQTDELKDAVRVD